MLSACSNGDAAGSGFQSYRQLCQAVQLASAGKSKAAARRFAQIHEPLHSLAQELQKVDRTAAGNVLRAKAAVESDIDSGSPQLAADLYELSAKVRLGVGAEDELPAPCRGAS